MKRDFLHLCIRGDLRRERVRRRTIRLCGVLRSEYANTRNFGILAQWSRCPLGDARSGVLQPNGIV